MNSMNRNLLRLQSFEFSGEKINSEAAMLQKIERLRTRLSVQILREYDHRKEHFGGSSFVPIKEGVCLGCCVSVSQRTQRESEEHPVECEHCGRLVYNVSIVPRRHLEICAA